jgi:hypothetical protein
MPYSGLIIGFPLATMHLVHSAVYAFCAYASAQVTSVTKAWKSCCICCTISSELELMAALLG